MKAEMKSMSVGSLFDKAFRMSFGKFKDLLKVTFLFFIFLVLITGIAALATLGIAGVWNLPAGSSSLISWATSMGQSVIEKINIGVLVILWAVFLIIIIAADIIYNGILNHLFLQEFMEEDWKLKKSMKTVWKKTGSLFFSVLPISGIFIAFIVGASIVIGLSVILGFIGLFVSITGVVIFSLYGIVAVEMVGPIIIGEDTTGGRL